MRRCAQTLDRMESAVRSIEWVGVCTIVEVRLEHRIVGWRSMSDSAAQHRSLIGQCSAAQIIDQSAGMLDQMVQMSIGACKCQIRSHKFQSDHTDLRQWSWIIVCIELCIFAFSEGKAK